MELVKKIETKRPINWAAYRLGKTPFFHLRFKCVEYSDSVISLSAGLLSAKLCSIKTIFLEKSLTNSRENNKFPLRNYDVLF